jgi:hypothetical protein
MRSAGSRSRDSIRVASSTPASASTARPPSPSTAAAYGAALQPGGGFVVAGLTVEGQAAIRTALARVLTAAPPAADGNGGSASGEAGGASGGAGAASGGTGGSSTFGASTLVTLKLAAERIPARGPLKVRVTNQNGFAVTGTLSGQTTTRVSVTRKRRTALKARSFSVAANAGRTVQLKLPRTLRRLHERSGKLVLQLTAQVIDPAGNSRTLRTKLTPKLQVRGMRP